MNANELATVDQLRAFLGGAQRVAFEVASDKDARYGWIRKTLVQFRYLELRKPDKGVVIRYLVKVSGYSRQQVTRLKQYRDTGRLARRQRAVKGFRRRYTPEDIRRLAAMDAPRHAQRADDAQRACAGSTNGSGFVALVQLGRRLNRCRLTVQDPPSKRVG